MMNPDSFQSILWIVVVWPLLLAIPAIHSRLPWPRHLALLPALILLLFAANVSVELPWLLFGTGFAINDDSRWILAMTIIIWLTVASIDKARNHKPGDKRTSTFFQLTLAGNLGALLSTELVGFFCFSTLMGYGFYALLMEGGDAKQRRAGRIYLLFLILADLALFEALLLAAYSTDKLHYLSVHQAMPGSGSSQFYFWMAFVGFAFKAGIWPAHVWLSATYRSAAVSRTLLLAGVPVTMALLGMLRWLAFTEHSFSFEGLILQVLGSVAVLFSVIGFVTSRSITTLPKWLCISGTGLFITALGTALVRPDIWQQYAYLAHPVIATWVILLAALSLVVSHLPDMKQQSTFALQLVETSDRWAARWKPVLQQWTRQQILKPLSHWGNSRLQGIKKYHNIIYPLTPKTGWLTSITLFVLLGLAIAWLAG